MMSYYLPITRKLIDAYVELGEAGIDGENIAKTKLEIEMSLDTVNDAFETFLDSFYEDTAWDISSDITAMKTMMARDGLTGNGDFQRVRNVGNDVRKAEEEAGMPAQETARTAEAGQEPAKASAVGHGGSGISLSFGSGAGAAAAAPMEEEER
jgi:hypothetical protein